MIPHGAPTTWFSASWQSAASRSGSMSSPPSARAVATSRAALDDTPDRRGHVGGHRELDARRVDQPVADEHERDAEHVVGPPREVRERGPHLGIRSGAASVASSSSAKRRGSHDQRVGRFGDHRGHQPGRRLEHQRARVVGDAPEQVEAARRATADECSSTSSARIGTDDAAKRGVGVADPRDRRGRVEGRVERTAPGVGDDAAGFLEQHRGADVVGVAREGRRGRRAGGGRRRSGRAR